MSLDSPRPVFIVAVTIVAIVVLMWTGKIWARRQVTRWCEREGYELVSFRGAWFLEGPRHGETRMGYVVFGSWYPFSRKGHG
jgi:hypothetical protein